MSRTPPRSSSPASWSSTPRPTRSSRTRGQAHRGVRHREVRVARHGYGRRPSTLPARAQARSRNPALGGLDLVIEQLDRVLEALEHQDIELATMVITDDDRIDGRYLEVHQGILSLLARQAPVAGDLRLVAALLHVIKHVERMGDQCVNIAKLIPLSGHEPPVRAEVLELLLRMGRAARSEVVQSRAAFADSRHGAGRGPRAPGPRDQPPQPRDLPARDRDRRRTPTRASGRCT